MIIAASRAADGPAGELRYWTMLVCSRCAGAVLVETSSDGNEEVRVIPEVTSEGNVEALPESVERHYRAAMTVLNAGVPSSAAVELRKTLEAAAQAHGVNESPLARAIEKLAEQGLITKDFTKVLGHIRKLGNLGAHASDVNVAMDEAEIAMQFTTQVLRNLFEIPAKLRALNDGSGQGGEIAP